jgi:hypothetical protein
MKRVDETAAGVLITNVIHTLPGSPKPQSCQRGCYPRVFDSVGRVWLPDRLPNRTPDLRPKTSQQTFPYLIEFL